MAEVLITLTIIGVIAALTIPTLKRKYEDYQTVVAVKSAYSILNQAMMMAIRENGKLDNWDWPIKPGWWNEQDRDYFLYVMSKHLKMKKCEKKGDCPTYGWINENTHVSNKDGSYKYLRGKIGAEGLSGWGRGKAILANGMSVMFIATATGSTDPAYTPGRITVDINGAKLPNRMGFDTFVFEVYNDGLRPYRNWLSGAPKNLACNLLANVDHYEDGSSCSEWILKHGNMDYKYRDVSKEW